MLRGGAATHGRDDAVGTFDISGCIAFSVSSLAWKKWMYSSYFKVVELEKLCFKTLGPCWLAKMAWDWRVTAMRHFKCRSRWERWTWLTDTSIHSVWGRIEKWQGMARGSQWSTLEDFPMVNSCDMENLVDLKAGRGLGGLTSQMASREVFASHQSGDHENVWEGIYEEFEEQWIANGRIC